MEAPIDPQQTPEALGLSTPPPDPMDKNNEILLAISEGIQQNHVLLERVIALLESK